MSWKYYGDKITWGVIQFGACDGGTKSFFTQCKRRIWAAFLFKCLSITRTLDPVTGSSLKRWLQRNNLFRSQVAQATTQTQAEQNCSSDYGRVITGCCSEESQEHAVWRKICEKWNSRVVYFKHFGSNICWTNANIAKIWNLRNFC